MRPNFLVIGAMKAGTDSLWEYLRRHPEIFMPEPKELDFFVDELNWRRGAPWYEGHFREADGARAIGEASTSYSKSPLYDHVPERIAAALPDVRLIYLVRHPIERIRSQYLHQRLLGLERRPVETAVLADPSYVDFSRYSMQLGRYLDQFDRSRILIITSDDLLQRRRATLERVFGFLGVAESWSDAAMEQEFHTTSDKRVLRRAFESAHGVPLHDAISRRVPAKVKELTLRFRTRTIDPSLSELSAGVRRRLEDTLRPDVLALRSYLGPEFNGWGIA